MNDSGAAYFAVPGAMTALPNHSALGDLPGDPGALRRVVQGLLVHRDWVPAYGIAKRDARFEEQNLRSVAELLGRALEISADPLTRPRRPIDRVVCICRHYAVLYTALLRSTGTAARSRCGFSNYFDRSKWYDHWITERWNGERWVRDDPQIDVRHADILGLDFDPFDQPAGQFLTGAEAWTAARLGLVDSSRFGIFDMWGPAYIAGNVLTDFACLNKVELLPWDAWGIGTTWGPHDILSEETAVIIDEVAALAVADDVDAIRSRYLTDSRVTVPPIITTFVDGQTVLVRLDD